MNDKNLYYDQIMNLNGMEEMKEEVRNWEILAENIGRFPTEYEILLPDYFWIARAGSGKTRLLRLLAEYLEQRNIMSFCGNHKVIEFELEYYQEKEQFSELTRLMKMIDMEAGYHRLYRGILAIHMTAWAGHMHEKNMYRFLEFLSENTRDWFIVLIADVDEDTAYDMKKQISYYLRIRSVRLELPSTDILYSYLESRCRLYGIELSHEASHILRETIEVLRASRHFEGYNTLNLMAQEMIYELYSKQILESRMITADMLAAYGPQGEFTKNYMEAVSEKKNIGFEYSGEEQE